jgi:endoglucanase
MELLPRGALHRFAQTAILIASLCLIVALPAHAHAAARHAPARHAARHRCRVVKRTRTRTDKHKCAAPAKKRHRHKAKPKAGKAKPKAGKAKPKAGTVQPKARPPIPANPITSSPASTGAAGSAGDPFYVDPGSAAASEVSVLRAGGQTAQANQLQVIAGQPQAIWLTDDNSGSQAAVSAVVGTAAAAGKIPVLVTYNLPWRDCGSFSAGGASSPADYEGYIDAIVSGIGQRKVVMVIEPDALTELSCLPASEQQSYYQLLHYAALRLSTDANAAVYVDAGNVGWQPASVEAAGLNQVLAGTNAAGFAVNVSNFYSTAANVAYGTAISQATGGKHFVIDTSRNGGNVAAGLWCNPAGAALGQTPTTNTGNALVDADLWIKRPGESDGTCNGGPSAGAFWLTYALQLASH